MTKEEFKKLVMNDDGSWTKQRFREEWFINLGVWDWMNEVVPPEFESIKSKILYILDPTDAYCPVCGEANDITKREGGRFIYMHKKCRKGNTTLESNRKDLDEERIFDMYVNQKMSMYDILETDAAIDRKTGEKVTRIVLKRILKDHIRSNSEAIKTKVEQCGTNKPLNIPRDEVLKRYSDGESVQELAFDYKCNTQTIRKLLVKHDIYDKTRSKNISSQEKIICKYLDTLSIEYTQSDRSIITPYELDIYIPSHKLAIEVNGSYWHSDVYKDNNYHKNKRQMCVDNGVTLIQFMDIEINDNIDLVFSMIRNKLGMNENKVYARNTTIKELTPQEASLFFNRNHIKGNMRSSVKYGLYDGNSLVCAMTFGKPRFNNKYEWEIIRSASKRGCSVVGGVSKLLKHFIHTHNPQSIISYCDYSYNNGDSYLKAGFEYLYDTEPNYLYVNDYIQYSRYQCQKQKLKKLFPEHYDDTLTEVEIMRKAGYHMVFNSGNGVFVWTNKT